MVNDQQQSLKRAVRAERQARLATVLCLALTLYVALSSASSRSDEAASGTTVNAPFQVVDSNGIVIVKVESIDGRTAVLLNDALGAEMVKAESIDGRVSLTLNNGAGRRVVSLFSPSRTRGGAIQVTAANDDRLPSVLLIADPDAGPSVSLRTDNRARPVADLYGTDKGAQLEFWGKEGNEPVVRLESVNGKGALRLAP